MCSPAKSRTCWHCMLATDLALSFWELVCPRPAFDSKCMPVSPGCKAELFCRADRNNVGTTVKGTVAEAAGCYVLHPLLPTLTVGMMFGSVLQSYQGAMLLILHPTCRLQVYLGCILFGAGLCRQVGSVDTCNLSLHSPSATDCNPLCQAETLNDRLGAALGEALSTISRADAERRQHFR